MQVTTIALVAAVVAKAAIVKGIVLASRQRGRRQADFRGESSQVYRKLSAAEIPRYYTT